MGTSKFVTFLLILNTILLLFTTFVSWKIFYYPAFQASLQRQAVSSPSPVVNSQAQQSPSPQGRTAFDSFYNSLPSSQQECIENTLGSERVEELRSKLEVPVTSEESSQIANCVQ